MHAHTYTPKDLDKQTYSLTLLVRAVWLAGTWKIGSNPWPSALPWLLSFCQIAHTHSPPILVLADIWANYFHKPNPRLHPTMTLSLQLLILSFSVRAERPRALKEERGKENVWGGMGHGTKFGNWIHDFSQNYYSPRSWPAKHTTAPPTLQLRATQQETNTSL